MKYSLIMYELSSGYHRNIIGIGSTPTKGKKKTMNGIKGNKCQKKFGYMKKKQ